MRATNKDSNHSEIMRAFMQCGFHVIDTASALGMMLDLIVRRGKTVWFVEIKSKHNARLTDNEYQFINAHREVSLVVETIDDVLLCQRGDMAGLFLKTQNYLQKYEKKNEARRRESHR
jgi:Holliday junction resolvase-like predicted endonuclease